MQPATATEKDNERFVAEQYRLHARSVLRKCLMLSGGDQQWAEDVTHDVFCRLIEHCSTLDKAGSMRPWLHRVAYRLGVDRLRRERGAWQRIKDLLKGQRPDVASHSPELVMQVSADLEQVRHTLVQLPAKERAVVVMKHVDGMSQKEIATTLGHSEGYVSKILKRATEHIRSGGWELHDG